MSLFSENSFTANSTGWRPGRLYSGRKIRQPPARAIPGNLGQAHPAARPHGYGVACRRDRETRPFRVEAGRALGPGVFDMKAGILLMWMALEVSESDKPVTVLLTSDEEIGSSSSRALIESEAGRCSAVSGARAVASWRHVEDSARRASERFTVKAIGRAAHAGIDPEKGVNAIEEISRQILKLQKMTRSTTGHDGHRWRRAGWYTFERRSGGSGGRNGCSHHDHRGSGTHWAFDQGRLPRIARARGWKFTAASIGRRWSGPAIQIGCLNWLATWPRKSESI